jgi:tetratricopeptide (TPR) repeat protein
MAIDTARLPEGEAAAREATELDPNNAIAYYKLEGLLAKDHARTSEAEAAYRKAIELEPHNARYVYRLGLLLHEKLNRFAEAESAYRRAIELAPGDPFYYGGLVSLLVERSRRSEALALAAQMRALLSATEQRYGLATLDSILCNVEAAIEHLRKAAQADNFDRAWARIDPDLASIRADPRIDEILGNDPAAAR